jgi:Family of unknown function (DUF6011)
VPAFQMAMFEPAAEMAGQFTDGEAAKTFFKAGNAHVTLKSLATGNRFTYRIRPPKGGENPPTIWFVQLLVGTDNDSSYKYIGQFNDERGFWHGRKSSVGEDATSVKAFDWCWQSIRNGQLPVGVEVWHEGRCGRCARRLTVPESIASGFGPECINHIGGH